MDRRSWYVKQRAAIVRESPAILPLKNKDAVGEVGNHSPTGWGKALSSESLTKRWVPDFQRYACRRLPGAGGAGIAGSNGSYTPGTGTELS